MRHSRIWLWVALLAAACGGLAVIPRPAQAATGGDVCLYGTDATGDTGDPMMAGTSPTIFELSNGDSGVNYQSAGGYLAGVYDTGGAPIITSYSMDPKTSPADSLNGGGTAVAITGSDDQLYVGTGASMTPTGQYVAAGTSPGAAELSSGTAEYVYNSASGTVMVGDGSNWSSTGSTAASGSSPAIAPLGASNPTYIAFQATNGDLWLYGATGTLDTGHAMGPGTSPSITATSSGYEVAYQCAPAAATTTTTTAEQTTTVSATTPSTTSTTATAPSSPGPTRQRALPKFSIGLTWNGRTTHLSQIRPLKRLPRGALITFTCTRDLKGDRCPKLGQLAKRRRTIARELAVVADRIFTKDNVLTITVSAPRYTTEVFALHLTGSHPTITQRWK